MCIICGTVVRIDSIPFSSALESKETNVTVNNNQITIVLEIFNNFSII
jgi:hypothetical protein